MHALVHVFQHFLTFVSDWTYSTGFINYDMISEHLFPPSSDGIVLMCGPPPMINFACIPNLEKAGFTPEMRFAY
jgi:cytochrome-b5 reductase